MAHLALTRRALLDIQDIDTFSDTKWGQHVAGEYLDAIEEALNRLRENPQLLRAKQDVSASLCFYRVRQHFLVCAVYADSVFVLSVKHGAMDLPNRIKELEPQLLVEAEMMYKAYRKRRS